ncbi:MAG: M20/M25/M40 family metallo-hydrolase [Anaerolineaceae bacterium]|nr:M20/M25/M40 family metallo-hydrolase [Anaerolineaceae bacterium]
MQKIPRLVSSAWQAEMIGFCQRLIQTPSLSGHEGEIAALIQAEMKKFAFDEISTDEVGNVIGKLKGGSGPSLQFNCHMDQVDIGDRESWQHDPFGGEIVESAVHGRGASDTKGAIAAQIHALGRLKQSGISFHGDVYMVCVVQEETGSWGSKYLLEHFKTDLAVLGEATGNQIANGHRGRAEILVEFQGVSTHAAAAQKSDNPLFPLVSFLQKIAQLPISLNPLLGKNSINPTRCYTDQLSGNMTPDLVKLHLDWRSLPEDSLTDLLHTLQEILDQICQAPVRGSAKLFSSNVTSYNGYTGVLPAYAPAYLLPEEHPLPAAACSVLESVLNRQVSIKPWGFTTDGGYLVQAGIPTIGFSPCEEKHAHTVHDQVDISLLKESLLGTMALAISLPEEYEKSSIN